MAGHYRLIQFLGKGPYTEVYLGQHILVPQMQYAIKKPAALSDEAIQTLQRRASILSQLDHPSILKMYPLEGSASALGLSLASQGSLHEQFQAGRAHEFRWIVLTTLQLALALAYAHSQGIVHGNLKAPNILFDRNGDVFLSDFDVLTPAFVQFPLVLQALPYRAPEQEQGHAWPATDQYQLAHLVENWLQRTDAEQHAPAEALAAFKRTLHIAQRASVAQRYQDMSLFARDVEKVAAMHPYTISGRASPSLRHAHPLLCKSVLLLLLLILGGSFIAGLALREHIFVALTPTTGPRLSPQALYQQITHTRPALADPPAGEGAGQWSGQHNRTGGSCSLSATTLSLVSPNGSPSEVDCTLNDLTVSNFAFQATMRFGSNDRTLENMQAGLFFRTSYTYIVDVPLSTCTFTARSSPPVHLSTGCTFSHAQSAANVLCVIALQHTFFLYINGAYVATASDEHYRSGSLGVFLLNDTPAPGQLAVSFTNVNVWFL